MSKLKLQEVTHLAKPPNTGDTEQTQHSDGLKAKPRGYLWNCSDTIFVNQFNSNPQRSDQLVTQFLKHNTLLLINDQNWIWKCSYLALFTLLCHNSDSHWIILSTNLLKVSIVLREWHCVLMFFKCELLRWKWNPLWWICLCHYSKAPQK